MTTCERACRGPLVERGGAVSLERPPQIKVIQFLNRQKTFESSFNGAVVVSLQGWRISCTDY